MRDERVQKLHKYPGRKALGLGEMPRIHLERQKDLWSRKREKKREKPWRKYEREDKMEDSDNFFLKAE